MTTIATSATPDAPTSTDGPRAERSSPNPSSFEVTEAAPGDPGPSVTGDPDVRVESHVPDSKDRSAWRRLWVSATGSSSDLPWRPVVALLVLALAVRVVCLLGQPLIGADAARFLAAAEAVEAGDVYPAFEDPYHPLPAFAFGSMARLQNAVLPSVDAATVDGFRTLQQRREMAAHWISLISGLAIILLAMDLTRRHFIGVPPLLVGLLATFHPYLVRNSVDIMSDSLYLGLLLLALRQASVFFETPRTSTAVSCGGAIGLAYLCRPEALVLLPTVVATGFVLWMLRGPSRSGSTTDIATTRRAAAPGTSTTVVSPTGLRSLWGASVVVAVTVALVFPYIYAIYIECGEWCITRKKSLSDLLGLGMLSTSQPEVLRAGLGGALTDLEAIWRVITRWWFAGPEVLGAFTLIGAFAFVRGREWRLSQLLFLFCAALLVVVYLLLLHSEGGSYRYLTKRHVLTLAVLGLPFAARGIQAFAALVQSGARIPRSISAMSWLLVAVLISIGAKALAPQRLDQLAQRVAAERILESGGRGSDVFSDREKIAYYSGADYHQLHLDPWSTIQQIRRHPGSWLAFYRQDHPEFSSELEADPGQHGLELVAVYEETLRRKPRHLVVFRAATPH